MHDADEDAGVASLKAGGLDAGLLDGFPGGLEQEALLGVDGEGFTWADAEEGGVEVVGVVEEAALAHVALSLCIGVVECVDVPAAVVGKGGDGILTIGEHLPEVFGGSD